MLFRSDVSSSSSSPQSCSTPGRPGRITAATRSETRAGKPFRRMRSSARSTARLFGMGWAGSSIEPSLSCRCAITSTKSATIACAPIRCPRERPRNGSASVGLMLPARVSQSRLTRARVRRDSARMLRRSSPRKRAQTCRLGKGAGSASQQRKAYRAPCPVFLVLRIVTRGHGAREPLPSANTVPPPLPTLRDCSAANVSGGTSSPFVPAKAGTQEPSIRTFPSSGSPFPRGRTENLTPSVVTYLVVKEPVRWR